MFIWCLQFDFTELSRINEIYIDQTSYIYFFNTIHLYSRVVQCMSCNNCNKSSGGSYLLPDLRRKGGEGLLSMSCRKKGREGCTFPVFCQSHQQKKSKKISFVPAVLVCCHCRRARCRCRCCAPCTRSRRRRPWVGYVQWKGEGCTFPVRCHSC
jgi:hypothetical protein